MGKIIRLLLMGIVGIVVVGGLLYVAGFRMVGPSGAPLLSGNDAGSGKGQPGWRRAQQQAGGMGPGSGQRKQMARGDESAPPSGSQGGRRQGGGSSQQALGNESAPPPGSQGGRRQGGGSQQARGTQPGFGPTGGILLPIRVGTNSISILVNGRPSASFVGKDLTDHVEDTTIATAEGPRKGWSAAKTLNYLKIDNAKEAVVIDATGKKQAVSALQLNDQETIALFTYNDKGDLMLISGPKVRGVNKGKTSLEEVKQMVSGRHDLLSVTGIVKVEVKS
jgi:hypothetical protein